MLRYLVYLFLLIGCQSGHRYLIQGHLSDEKSNGEWIYLVPVENPTKESVDSVMIANGEFKFEGSAEVPEIYIIRAKPLLRFTLQELLVVRESGNLIVAIGTNSMVSGTALNDSLQRWKEQKVNADYLYEELRQQFILAGETDQSVIKQKASVLNSLNVDFNYTFVRNNRDNVVGKFVNKLMGNSFSPEQQKSLKLK